MTTIATQLRAVTAQIASAATQAGRSPESVLLLAVSKTFPASAVREAALAGQRHFGENYIQEGVEKNRRSVGHGRSAALDLALHPPHSKQ